jgi:hypothetical protein
MGECEATALGILPFSFWDFAELKDRIQRLIDASFTAMIGATA